MTPVGQAYRPEGRIDARALLQATILGVTTAVVAAVIVWLWELSPIPTLVILTPIVHGLVIGAVLAALIGRLKLRHPKLMWTVGAACGLASVGLIHYAHYLHFLDESGKTFRAIQARAADDDELTPDQRKQLMAADPNDFTEKFLVKQTGHSGLVGSMFLRAEQGYQIKNMHVSGTGTWVLWGLETLAVVLVAASMARGRAATPFCEDCGEWCGKAPTPVRLAGESSRDFADALATDDLRRAVHHLGQPVDAEARATGGTTAALHSCAACDQTFVDVDTYVTRIKKGKAETTTNSVLRLVRVSPEMTTLLRAPLEPPTADEDLASEGASETESAGLAASHQAPLDGSPLERRDP